MFRASFKCLRLLLFRFDDFSCGGHGMSFLFWFAEKERELTDAHAEIKALKVTERSREKAFEEV